MKIQNGTRPPFGPDVDTKNISEKCENYSGADVSALVREAALIAARELLQADEHKMEQDSVQEDVFLTMSHFERALLNVKSSVSEKDRKFYEKMKEQIEK